MGIGDWGFDELIIKLLNYKLIYLIIIICMFFLNNEYIFLIYDEK